MSTSTKITVAQYDKMIRQGLFEPREEHHVELIYGEIRPMSPISAPHSYLVSRIVRWSIEALPADLVHVVPQGPIGIPALDSEPEPDVFWVNAKDYWDEHPNPANVPLVIEVSERSLSKDRGLKARLYAEAGIADYWIVNVKGRCVEVRRNPQGKAYRSIEVFRAGQEVHPLAFPDVWLPVSLLFPE